MPKIEPNEKKPAARIEAALATPTDLRSTGTAIIARELNMLVADAFALYVKTKNFHWHMSGPHFRDYHLLLDEQAAQILASIDPLAERVRKLGQRTIVSLAQISELASIEDNLETFVPPERMLQILTGDNKAMAENLRRVHGICDENHDPATASLLEVFIDETERRTWFLFETSRPAGAKGH